MVKSENRFLIDATFIVERAHKMFFGAPLMTAAGKDHTFTYGCVRDVLRVRRKLGIKAGVLILGKEAVLTEGCQGAVSESHHEAPSAAGQS